MLKKLIIILIIITTIIVGVLLLWQKNNKEISAAATKSGLVGYWTMDSGDVRGNTVYDKSGFNRHGIKSGATGANNTPQPIVGKIKQGLNFDMTDDKISITSKPSIGTGDITITQWIKSPDQSNSIFFYLGNDASKQSIYFLNDLTPGNVIQFGTYGVAANLVPSISRASLLDNQWHFLVGIKQSDVMTIYLDGVQKDQKTVVGVSIGTSILEIGSGTAGPAYILGNIDETRIYNRALSAQEVTNLYNASGIAHTNTPVKASSTPSVSGQLVGHWTMDNGDRTGNKILDKSGFNNNGTLIGTTTSTGRLKEARNFNGSSDYVSASHHSSITPTGDYTISAWVKSSSANGEQSVVTKFLASGNYPGYLLSLGSATTLTGSGGSDIRIGMWVGEGGGSGWTIGNTLNKVNNGSWHHIVGSLSGTTVNLYLDGQSDGSSTKSPNRANTNNLEIGRRYDIGGYFPGSIDDVRIYNYALSAQDVSNLYNSAKIIHTNTATKTGLVGYWTMNNEDRSRNLIYDKSGFNNHGTIFGTTTSTGIIKQAKDISGSGDYITVTDNTSLKPMSAVTVSAWIKLDSQNNSYSCGGAPATVQYLVFKKNSRTGSFTESYVLYKDDFWYFFISNAAGTQDAAVSTDIPRVGKWTHIVGVFNRPNMQIFVDGKPQGTDTHDFDLDHSTADLQIGRNGTCGTGWEGYFNGSIDDVRVYNRALSAQEVVNLYNSARGNYK